MLLLTEIKDYNQKTLNTLTDQRKKVEMYVEFLETDTFSHLARKKVDEKIKQWREEMEDLYHVSL